MRVGVIILAVALLLLSGGRNGQAQPPDPTLLRITFGAAMPTPTATPDISPTVSPPDPTPPSVPEPGTCTLVGIGAVALALVVRQARRRRMPCPHS